MPREAPSPSARGRRVLQFFGDEKRPMLQRIYGTAWENAEQLAEHRRLKAEAARRDHRKIGADLNLFSIQPAAGGGLVFWHPKGAYMRTQMEQYWKDCHVEGGYRRHHRRQCQRHLHRTSTSSSASYRYDLLYTPHMASIDLWKTSGHFDFYKDDMFDQMEVTRTAAATTTPRTAANSPRTPRPPPPPPPLPSTPIHLFLQADDNEYQIKPMNCPFHVLTFKDSPKSYRDLPIRWAELGTVYRYERSGALNGLFRVRGFTQDDAHIFCLPDQLTDEILGVLDLTERILSKFGFTKYEV